MTIEQALRILEEASAMAALPKQGHVNVQMALDLIKKELEKKEEKAE